MHSRSAQTLAVAFLCPGRLDRSRRHPGTIFGSRRRLIRSRITRNNRFGTATSAIWKTIYLEWTTTLAPILISFSRSVVRDQCFTAGGRASRRRKRRRLPRWASRRRESNVGYKDWNNHFEEWKKVGSDRAYHYLGSAVWYTRIGHAAGEAMVEMLKSATPGK